MRATMPGTKSNQEIEIKLRVANVSELRRRLNQLGAREVSLRTHESNTLYDTPKKALARRSQLIRIRIEKTSPAKHGAHRPQPAQAVLTFKGPPQASSHVRPAIGTTRYKSRYKVREEVEIAISDAEQMHRILIALGLRPIFRYEKFRTTYALRGLRNLKIEFDETPIGTFLELEGSPSAIDRAARLLGYARSHYITQSYGALYIADRREPGAGSSWSPPGNRHVPANMLFPPTKKMR
jgi:adenylate cyclase class 2